MTIRLEKDGKLILEQWVYDEEKGEGWYEDVDISQFKDWVHKRDQTVKLGEGVCLNDLFLIVSKEPELCDVMFTNCFIKEFVRAWKNKSVKKPDYVYDKEGIEFIEVYWATELFTFEGVTKLDGDNLPAVHGIGWELKEDYYHGGENAPAWKLGDRIPWGIDFMPLEKLLYLPLKINTEFKVQDDWTKPIYKDNGICIVDVPFLLDVHKDVTLHQLIEAVFWEISFYGSEEDKSEKAEELQEMAKEVKMHMSEELNDGYINDGWHRESH